MTSTLEPGGAAPQAMPAEPRRRLVVQPAALGSYAVSSRSVVPGGGEFPPLAAPAGSTGGYRPTRFVIFCCAADAVHPSAPPRPPYEYTVQFIG